MLGWAGLGGDAKEAVHEVARVAVVLGHTGVAGFSSGQQRAPDETGRVGYRQ